MHTNVLLLGLIAGLSPFAAGCSLLFPSDGYGGEAVSIDDLCASSDVVRCFTFDDQATLDSLYSSETCVGQFTNCYGVIDDQVRFEGAGALLVELPKEQSEDRDVDVGAFGLNFTPATGNDPPDDNYTVHFEPTDSFFISWRQRHQWPDARSDQP